MLTMMQTIKNLVQTMIWTTGDGGVCDNNDLLQYHIIMKVWYLQNQVYFIITNVFKEIYISHKSLGSLDIRSMGQTFRFHTPKFV